MDKSIFAFILRYSLPQQLLLLLMTVCSFPILYFSLELPKMIINDAISNADEAKELLGYSMGPETYLLALCGVFLLTIIVNGVFKMKINTFTGVIGERMVRRLRYLLVERIMRFPPPHFQRVSQGVMISTVTAETEHLAGYIGDSVSLPAFQGGTMITILTFMFMQDPILGIASIALIPLQMFIIPKLQKKVNALKRERVFHVRHLSERIGETVDSAVEIRLNGTHRYHLAEYSSILGTLFKIRLSIFETKYLMKFINNFINNLTPIMFYSIGGILAIQGNLTIGALVAAIAAHKDLAAPWTALLNHYQQLQDAKIKYEQITELFEPDNMFEYVPPSDDFPKRLDGNISLQNVTLINESGERVLRDINIDIKKGSTIAIASDNATVLRLLAHTLTGLIPPSSGHVLMSGKDIDVIPSATLSRDLTYAGPDPVMFNENVLQNINYSLRLKPPVEDPNNLSEERKLEIEEAEKTGNSTDLFGTYWTDFSLVHAQGWQDMHPHFDNGLKIVGADKNVYDMGMQDRYDPTGHPEKLTDAFVYLRQLVPTYLQKQGLADHLERIDEDNYLDTFTVAENIAFGAYSYEDMDWCDFSNGEEVQQFFKDTGLDEVGFRVGKRVAKLLTRLYFDETKERQLPANFDEFSDEEFRKEIHGLNIKDNQFTDTCQCLLHQLFLRFIPDRHGYDILTEEDKDAIMAARQQLLNKRNAPFKKYFEPFNLSDINKEISLYENILFGRPKFADEATEQRLADSIEQLLERENAKTYVFISLGFSQVGIRGARLPVVARQRIQIMRTLAKQPNIVVLHEPLSSLTLEERGQILGRIHESYPDTTLIFIDKELPTNFKFDHTYTPVGQNLRELMPN